MAAVGALGHARKAGLRVPQDLAIVGYNDIPLASRLIPGLTTVHVPIQEFGSAAARMLLEQIDGGQVLPTACRLHARSWWSAVRRRVAWTRPRRVHASGRAGSE